MKCLLSPPLPCSTLNLEFLIKYNIVVPLPSLCMLNIPLSPTAFPPLINDCYPVTLSAVNRQRLERKEGERVRVHGKSPLCCPAMYSLHSSALLSTLSLLTILFFTSLLCTTLHFKAFIQFCTSLFCTSPHFAAFIITSLFILSSLYPALKYIIFPCHISAPFCNALQCSALPNIRYPPCFETFLSGFLIDISKNFPR